jgi:hypothetical protein
MPRTDPSVVLLEFNELTPRLMDRFIREGQLPNFRRMRDESHIYTTDAACEGEDLNPWVQWVTVRTGLPAEQYGISRLSDGHKLQEKAVWDLLSDAGYRVWVCGSMNPRYNDPLNGFLLPDPWSTALPPYPKDAFGPYYRFVRGMVQEHTNESLRLSKLDALKFLGFMATHGLSFATVRKIVGQLWTERLTGKCRWRRATLLDHLQWDVFRRYYRKHRPHFSTFFLNSTAHLQHVHWRNLEPEVFTVKPSDADQAEHRDAVLYGYKNMDDLLGRFLRLIGPETTLIFCTALSQQPYLKLEATGGKHFYRLKDPAVLRDLLKVPGRFSYHPVMSEQFVLRFADAAEAAQALEHLSGYRLGEADAFRVSLQDLDLMVSCADNSVVPGDARITPSPFALSPGGRGGRGEGQSVPFFDVFYKVDNVKSGFHHPDGMLWVRWPNREHAVHADKVSLCAIAPAILEMFGVPQPEYMAHAPFTAEPVGAA